MSIKDINTVGMINGDVIRKAQGEINDLEQKCERLRKALEFYADRDEWFGNETGGWDLCFNSTEVDGHGWEVAERALKR